MTTADATLTDDELAAAREKCWDDGHDWRPNGRCGRCGDEAACGIDYCADCGNWYDDVTGACGCPA